MPLVMLDSLALCKDYIKGGQIKDGHGHSLEWKWDINSPGDGKRKAQFRCNSHVDCQVLARGVRVGDDFWVQTTADDHSTTKNLKGRKNSPATTDQRALVKAMVDSGSKPAGIQASLTSTELDKAKKAGKEAIKRRKGGLTGEAT